jgi:hypothetical protein
MAVAQRDRMHCPVRAGRACAIPFLALCPFGLHSAEQLPHHLGAGALRAATGKMSLQTLVTLLSHARNNLMSDTR